MKQYKSIVKDYTSGKEYVDIKHKPDLPICGYANVYLYNVQTGKLELEAHTPNIIYPEVYQWLRSYQWRKFAEESYNNTISDNGYWEMNNIYLTTSDRPETERVNIWNYDTRDVSGANPGKMIGWANKSTYIGSDTQRGTPNTAESYANNTKIHWVFDWPTNAGNGTFQSIIWGNQLVPYIGNIFTISTEINTGTYHSGFGLTYANGYLYAISYDGKLYKLTTDGVLSGSAISTGIDAGSSGYSGFGLTYANGYLYAISWDGNLYKLTTDGVLLGSAISTGINTGTYSWDCSNFGLAYANGYLYAISYDGKLYKLTTDGVLSGSAISTGIDAGSYGHSGFGLTYANGYLYAISWDGKLYKLTTDGILGSAISTEINTGTHYSNFGLAYANDYLYAISYDGNLYTINGGSDHFFARTLLPQPVTKTSTNTMKVQYDFIFED